MVTRITRTLMAGALLAAGLASAHAEGLYIGGGIGTPDYHSSINGIGGGGGNNSGTGVKLYGGYQLTPNFAIEGGAFNLGRTDDATGIAKTRGIYADGVGSYEFAPKWSVLGSVGVADARFTTTNGDDSSPALKLGAGVQYDLTHQTALRLQYDHYHFTNAFDQKPNVGEFVFGVKFGF
jgi:OOP family OmpA-OmpF porin